MTHLVGLVRLKVQDTYSQPRGIRNARWAQRKEPCKASLAKGTTSSKALRQKKKEPREPLGMGVTANSTAPEAVDRVALNALMVWQEKVWSNFQRQIDSTCGQGNSSSGVQMNPLLLRLQRSEELMLAWLVLWRRDSHVQIKGDILRRVPCTVITGQDNF